MQKMWAITAITLVGFMMIISSIPQDAFAGKNDKILNFNVIDGDGDKVKGVDCQASNSKSDAVAGTFFATDDTGKNGKITLTFDDPNGKIKEVWVKCDGSKNIWPYDISEKKNTRGPIFTY